MSTAGGAGFGGAFIQGLTSALETGRERKYRDQQRKQQSALSAANFLLGSGQVADVADLEPILSVAMPEVFGDTKGKKGGKGQPAVDHKGMVSQVLSSVLQGNAGGLQVPPPAGAATPSPARGPMFEGPIPQSGEGADPLPSKPLPTGLPSPGAPPRRMLGGVPLLSPEEVQAKETAGLIREGEADIDTKVAMMRRVGQILPALQATDPTITYQDALDRFGLRGRSAQAVRLQQVRGVVNGKETFGVFNPRSGEYLSPETGEPIQGFTPLTANSTYHYGVDREAAAKRLFGKSYGESSTEERAKADELVNQNAGAKAGATTTGRAEASAKAPLSTPQRFEALRSLQGDWRKAVAPITESKQAQARMEVGLRRFRADPVGASEAIRVGFEKLLSPESVVMPSEFARQGIGLSLMQKMQGYKQRYLEGGGDIPYEQLAEMVETAKQFNSEFDTYIEMEKERITQASQEAGLDPARVFGVAAAAASADQDKKPSTKEPGGVGSNTTGTTIPGFLWNKDTGKVEVIQ